MTLDEMKDKLRRELCPERYKHSIGVMDEAVRLATRYNLNREKVEIAGLLHDCAKHIDTEAAMEIVREHDIKLDEVQKNNPKLLHGILAPIIAAEHYGVTDEEILSAVYWHVTGRAGMTPIEKIIFVADYTEPGRTFQGVEEVRKLAYENINLCILNYTNAIIKHVLFQGDLLHQDTVSVRNEALLRIKQGNISI